MRNFIFIISILLQCILSVNANNFGFTPNYYRKGDKVDLLVNKVESDNTQLPFSYKELPFVCPPTSTPVHLSLGEILRGDRLWLSKYDLQFGVDMPCMRLCDLISKEAGLQKADFLIRNGYVAHWLVDGLPGATTFVSGNNNNKYYAAGFPMGFVNEQDKLSYIYNHVMIVIRYHREPNNLNTIVGFEVYPKSVSNEECPGASKNYENFAITFEKDSKEELIPKKTIIPYSYSVYWREDNTIDYNSRWDLYYENETSSNHQIHWFSVINSIVLMFLLSLIVAIVLLRVLKSDIQANSPTLPTNEYDMNANSSWKYLSNDITKKPTLPLVLSTLVASGIQIIIAIIGVICIFVINSKFSISLASSSLFNSHQGAVFSITLAFFIISGVIPSFCGIILHKIFNNDYLNSTYGNSKNISLSILFSGFLPSLIVSIVLFLNLFVWAKQASTAIPFGTIIVLLLLFFIIELPLGLLGGYYGNKYKFDSKSFLLSNSGDRKGKAVDNSTEVYHKKKSPWLLNPIYNIAVFGLIPFGIVYVELLFIFNSVWLEKTTFYYMYGFLLLTSIMLIVIIAESTIIATYLSIAVYNNPKWHWLCFNVGSSIGWYILGYSLYYFTYYLKIRDFVSILLYFSYMTLSCGLIGVGCGSVGVLTGLLFIKKIYSVVKVD